jgi:uroporphyrinogen decarboxylase
MTSHEVWEKEYRPLLVEFDRGRVGDVKAIAENLAKWRAKGKWACFGTQFIWENMRASMGDYTMYMALLTDPEWIHDFNRVYTDLYKKGFQILMEEAGKPDGVWLYEDLGYKQRLFCSPKTLEALIFPYYKEMVDFFHAYELPVVLHSCGFQELALPLIVQTGFDALNPMEVKAGNDIFKFAEQYGDRLVFIGGLDARILESGDRETIRKGVTDFITGMKQRGARFVYGSDHSLSTNIDYDDFLYSLEVYHGHKMR